MTDLDDERLGALFRAAASDGPSPPFDHGDVVAASRRITARRRAAVAGGALALLAVAGVGAAVVRPGSLDRDSASTVAVPMAAPETDGVAAPEAAAGSVEAPLRDVAPLRGTPLGPGTGECADRQDPALRAYVEQVLPEVAGAPEAATTEECRPGGERGVSLEVDDHGAAGLLTVQYLPPGTEAAIVPGAVSAPTASGGTVIVSTRAGAPDDPAPFADRLDTAAAFLAPRL